MPAGSRRGGVVLAHPGTAPFVQQAARGLHEAGLLESYVTTFAYRPESLLGRGLRMALRAMTRDPEDLLRRREITEVPLECVDTHPIPEMLRMLAYCARLGPVAEDMVWEKTERRFVRTIARRHLRDCAAIYAYDHAALEAFQAAKERGVLCLYEMPQAHHATVSAELGQEYQRLPALRSRYSEHLDSRAAKRNARRDAEMSLADHIVVNSSFTRDSLITAGIAEGRISLVPLGAPPVTADELIAPSGPFIFLSAGSQSVRKGVHYLLDAWRRLGAPSSAELWLVGRMQLPASLVADLPGTVVTRPTMGKDELFALYRRAGALIFPSLCEGFGMVITEAMANGLPVITTPHTAGRDLITDRKNGLLVPVRDADALAGAMQFCLDHPDEMAAMRHAARDTAAAWQWEDYRRAFAATLGGFLSRSSAQVPCA